MAMQGTPANEPVTAGRTAQSVRSRVYPLFKCPGGKSYLAKQIISQFPARVDLYVEPFVGAGSVFNHLPQDFYRKALLNDLHRGVATLFRVVRDNVRGFRARLCDIPYTEDAFVYWRDLVLDGSAPAIDTATKFYVTKRMSRGALGRDFAWSERRRGGRPGDLNAWLTSLDRLPSHSARLQGVRITNVPALNVVASIADNPRALGYLDPPYLHETRVAKQSYEYEMSDGEHRELLDLICYCRCGIAISGYRSRMYDDALKDWHRVDVNVANHAGQGKKKQRRTECLWVNSAALALAS